jgi:hypothetical protein
MNEQIAETNDQMELKNHFYEHYPFAIKVNNKIVGWMDSQEDAQHAEWCLSFQNLLATHKNDEFVELFLDYLNALKTSSKESASVPA